MSAAEITFEMISERFKDYIMDRKPGLQRFYKANTREELDSYLKDPVDRALNMTKDITKKGCP